MCTKENTYDKLDYCYIQEALKYKVNSTAWAIDDGSAPFVNEAPTEVRQAIPAQDYGKLKPVMWHSDSFDKESLFKVALKDYLSIQDRELYFDKIMEYIHTTTGKNNAQKE